jgi:hypothetical protein
MALDEAKRLVRSVEGAGLEKREVFDLLKDVGLALTSRLREMSQAGRSGA